MRNTLAGDGPLGGGGRDPDVTLLAAGAYLLELLALVVGDGPAALAAGTIAWVLIVLVELGEH